MTRRVKTGALLAAGTLGAGAAIAIASVPDGSGVVPRVLPRRASAAGRFRAAVRRERAAHRSERGQQLRTAVERARVHVQRSRAPPGSAGPAGPRRARPARARSPRSTRRRDDAGQAALNVRGAAARARLGGTTLQFDVLSVGYGVTGPAAARRRLRDQGLAAAARARDAQPTTSSRRRSAGVRVRRRTSSKVVLPLLQAARGTDVHAHRRRASTSVAAHRLAGRSRSTVEEPTSSSPRS